MTKEEHIQRWILSSDRDIPAMESLFANQHYVWSLFLAHLVIEKLLKAHYVKMIGDNVPYTHNLLKIARVTGLELTEQQESLFG
jgi:HEPN domain-containing protein